MAAGVKPKDPEQHLAEAKAVPVEGIEVIGPAKLFGGSTWYVVVRCLHCGTEKWVSKSALTRTKHCGCLSKRGRPKKESNTTKEKKVEQEKVVLTEEQKKEIDKTFGHEETVTIPRRLAEMLAREMRARWSECVFHELPPKIFNDLVKDTIAIYEAMNGAKR